MTKWGTLLGGMIMPLLARGVVVSQQAEDEVLAVVCLTALAILAAVVGANIAIVALQATEPNKKEDA